MIIDSMLVVSCIVYVCGYKFTMVKHTLLMGLLVVYHIYSVQWILIDIEENRLYHAWSFNQ